MPTTYLDIIKISAKQESKATGQKYNQVLSQKAKSAGFSNTHEMTEVAKKNPSDGRLILGAFGMGELGELIYKDELFYLVDSELSDAMSGPMAETNASMYMIDEMPVEDVDFDFKTSSLCYKLDIQYTAGQDPDRAYCGTGFYITATISFHWSVAGWQIDSGAGLEIEVYERDVDRDYRLSKEPEDF